MKELIEKLFPEVKDEKEKEEAAQNLKEFLSVIADCFEELKSKKEKKPPLVETVPVFGKN